MRDENMSYTVKSSERLRKSGSEAETKALLYLMNFRPDSDDIYYFVVDFFNDLTGMDNMASRLWDVQSKGAHHVSPKAIGKELVTLFKNSEKISAYSEEIERLSAEIIIEQERLQSLMDDESVSLESIVAYKKDIFSASDAEARIKEIDMEVATLKSQLLASENASIETQEQRVALLSAIIGKMNELYHQIDPDGNIIYSSLFTQRNEVYSGSEATIFHVVKLFALQFVLRHSFPIVIDSFRAEDLSTGKENTVLEISKSIDKQVILTTTLKHEEIGKYDDLPDVNHINYQSHTPSKILDGAFVESFVALLNDLSIEI